MQFVQLLDLARALGLDGDGDDAAAWASSSSAACFFVISSVQ